VERGVGGVTFVGHLDGEQISSEHIPVLIKLAIPTVSVSHLADLPPVAASFARSLRAAGKADRTRHLYIETITFYTQWLDQQGISADLSALTKSNVVDWLGELRDRKLADSTISYRRRALHRFARWCLDEKILDTDPLAGISVDRPEPPQVAVLADEDLTALIKACRGPGFRERRDEAMIRLLIDCGMRVAELADGAGGHYWKDMVHTMAKADLDDMAAQQEAGLRQQTPGLVLLQDLAQIWPPGEPFMASEDMIELLVKHNCDYWGPGVSPGGSVRKQLSAVRMGRMIKQATNTTSRRPGGGGTPRGYECEQFGRAWKSMGLSPSGGQGVGAHA
jgi:hypothetical protein